MVTWESNPNSELQKAFAESCKPYNPMERLVELEAANLRLAEQVEGLRIRCENLESWILNTCDSYGSKLGTRAHTGYLLLDSLGAGKERK